jgi:hypothetical protein
VFAVANPLIFSSLLDWLSSAQMFPDESTPSKAVLADSLMIDPPLELAVTFAPSPAG